MNLSADGYPIDFEPDEAAAVGQVLMVWSKVELMLHRMFEATAGLEPYLARLLAERLSASNLIETCRALAVAIEPASNRDLVLTWLSDVDKLRIERNVAIHSTWSHLFVQDRQEWVSGTLRTSVQKKLGTSQDVFYSLDLRALVDLQARITEVAFRRLPEGVLAPISAPNSVEESAPSAAEN